MDVPLLTDTGASETEERGAKQGFNSGSAVAGPSSHGERMDIGSSASASTRRLLWRQRELWASLSQSNSTQASDQDARSARSTRCSRLQPLCASAMLR